MVATKLMTSFATLALSSTLVAAGPFPRPLEPVPREASHLAFDERNNMIIAFKRDGSQLGYFNATFDDLPKKRDDSSSCSNLSVDDAKKLPGWKTLEDTAKKNWGDGSWNIATNPDDYKDQPAQICIDTEAIQVTSNDKQSCSESDQKTSGELVGSSGSVKLTKNDGSTYGTENTVTKTSSIAVGVKFGAKITIDKVLEIGEEVSVTTTFTNTLSESNKAESNEQKISETTMTAPEGKTCYLTHHQKQCSVEGTGKARFVATGWVWFNYNDKTHDHYKWALNMDQTLTNKDDRSTFMEFRSAVSSTTNSNYEGKCE